MSEEGLPYRTFVPETEGDEEGAGSAHAVFSEPPRGGWALTRLSPLPLELHSSDGALILVAPDQIAAVLPQKDDEGHLGGCYAVRGGKR